MGKNKLAKFAEMARFENVFQPPFGELKETPFGLQGEWKARYFRNQSPIVAELGCGKGEYTVGMAEKFPDRDFIGIDIKGARIYAGAKYAIEKGLRNVAFVRTRIENAGHLFGPGEVDEIWLTFPDPQQKNVHKRLTSSWYLKIYLEFLKPDGLIHLKTDSGFLYAYTRELLILNGFEITCQTGDLYGSGYLNDITGILTFYERQWLDRGIPIKYLSFRPCRRELWLEPADHFEKDIYRSYGRSARSMLSHG